MEIIVKIDLRSSHCLPRLPGKCRNMHGHTWVCEFYLEGGLQENGVIMDFHEAEEMIKMLTFDLDHACLNDVLPDPTCERLALLLLSRSERFSRVRVWESRDFGVTADRRDYENWKHTL